LDLFDDLYSTRITADDTSRLRLLSYQQCDIWAITSAPTTLPYSNNDWNILKKLALLHFNHILTLIGIFHISLSMRVKAKAWLNYNSTKCPSSVTNNIWIWNSKQIVFLYNLQKSFNNGYVPVQVLSLSDDTKESEQERGIFQNSRKLRSNFPKQKGILSLPVMTYWIWGYRIRVWDYYFHVPIIFQHFPIVHDWLKSNIIIQNRALRTKITAQYTNSAWIHTAIQICIILRRNF